MVEAEVQGCLQIDLGKVLGNQALVVVHQKQSEQAEDEKQRVGHCFSELELQAFVLLLFHDVLLYHPF